MRGTDQRTPVWRDFACWTREALFRPWRLHELPSLARHRTALFAGTQICVAAVLQAFLSTWTYLVGKGLILGRSEMDLGQDDLPPNTPFQVYLGFLVAIAIWMLLFSLVLGACRVVAPILYGSDAPGTRRARLHARVLTVWLTVGAGLTLATNGVLHQDLVRPASAIREHAQLRLHQPGDARALEARERFLPIPILFAILWAISLRPPPQWGRADFAVRCLAAYGFLWLLLWRLLPWLVIEAWTG